MPFKPGQWLNTGFILQMGITMKQAMYKDNFQQIEQGHQEHFCLFPEPSRTMAYTPHKTVYRLARKQQQFNYAAKMNKRRNKPIHQARET